ncbi:reverse transcriptase domain-containing protein [Tanacetum coccineum]
MDILTTLTFNSIGFVKFVLRTSKGSRAKDSVITHVVDVPIVPGNEGDVLTDICMNKMNNGTSAFLTVVPFSSTTGPTNVLNDADYDVLLPLASVHKGLKKVTMAKGFFFFKFSSIEGVDLVLRDGPWMIRGIPIFLNKWSPSMSLRRFVSCSSLGEISQCHVGFLYIRWIKLDRHENCDKMVMIVPDLKGKGYTKETIHVEYECRLLVLSNGFVEMGTCNRLNPKGKHFKTNPSISKKNVSTSGNGTFSLSNLFEVLNVDNPVIEKVETGNMASTSGVQEEEQSDQGSKDEVESVDNEMTSYLYLKPSRVGYGTKSLLE